jgi:hypothetical protein
MLRLALDLLAGHSYFVPMYRPTRNEALMADDQHGSHFKGFNDVIDHAAYGDRKSKNRTIKRATRHGLGAKKS